MKIRAVCPHCNRRLSRWFAFLTAPFLTYSCRQCGKRFRAESFSHWFPAMAMSVFLLVPFGLACAGVVPWLVPAAALVLAMLVALAIFPYVAIFVSAEKDATPTVEERLAALDRFRRQATFAIVTTGLGGLLFVAIVAGWFSGCFLDFDTRSLSIVRTRLLEVTDSKGQNAVTMWGGDEKGAFLKVANAEGKTVLTLVTHEDGADVILDRANGKSAAKILSRNDLCRLALCDSEGAPRLSLAANQGEGTFTIVGRDGRTILSAGEDSDGGGMIDLYNGNGVRVATVQTDKKGGGRIAILDAQGNVKRSLGASE